tara:strand:- start:204 stop:1043 length:840 start_codon:yes stop_codon:yes gene_type:complete
MEVVSGDECFRKLDSKQHLFYYFSAGWCKPCQEASPQIEELAKQYNVNKIKFLKVDMDDIDNKEFIMKCDVRSIPTFIIFKERNFLDRVVGFNLDGVKNMIENQVNGSGINKNIFSVQPHPMAQQQPPQPDNPPEPTVQDFYPNDTFQGEYEGYVFKSGEKGVGYYLDESSGGASGGGSAGDLEVHMVYGSWCGHSRNALPAFDELVPMTDIKTSVGSSVKFIKTEDTSDGMKQFREGEPTVRGFPTYMVVKPDGSRQELNGHDRSKDSIISAVKALTF